ncbi:MAG TPA: isochorismatase family cysteine hydrolase [Chloroflexota bacterium]
MPAPIVIVDVQRGFINEFTHHIPERIAQVIERGRHEPLLFTRFVNVPDSPYHRFLDWHEVAGPPDTELVPEMARLVERGRVFEKRGFTGLPDALGAYLRELGAEEVTVAGIDTDMCVLKIAIDIFDLGIRPVVLTDCCASTLGAAAHLAGLAVLSRNIGPHQLREAGLSEGTVAAPPTDEKG